MVKSKTALPEHAGHSGSPLISNTRLEELYAAMLRSHLLEKHLHRRTSVPAGSWPEAAVAAILLNLRASDSVGALAESAAENATVQLLRGISPRGCIEQARSRPAKSKDGTPPLVEDNRQGILPFVEDAAARLHLANGMALACRRSQSGSIVVVFTEMTSLKGKAAQSALALASAHRLPLIVAAQGRLRQSENLDPAPGGVPAIPVDGEDAVAVYRVAFESIARARRGIGPTLIRCLTAPAAASSGNESRSVIAMENYLTRKGLFDQARKARLIASFARELRRN